MGIVVEKQDAGRRVRLRRLGELGVITDVHGCGHCLDGPCCKVRFDRLECFVALRNLEWADEQLF